MGKERGERELITGVLLFLEGEDRRKKPTNRRKKEKKEKKKNWEKRERER